MLQSICSHSCIIKHAGLEILQQSNSSLPCFQCSNATAGPCREAKREGGRGGGGGGGGGSMI